MNVMLIVVTLMTGMEGPIALFSHEANCLATSQILNMYVQEQYSEGNIPDENVTQYYCGPAPAVPNV